MSAKVFVSYSGRDQEKADKIRAALEAANISCWIAPRDLQPGTQWGAGIVDAIQKCEAVVVVFSEAANASPQVAREMELAVSQRRQLVPIRVANAQPTQDMQYFLGVSHWFNAYEKPIEAYLPDIVASVQGVLARESNPFMKMRKRLLGTRNGQIGLSLGAALIAALVVAMVLKPANPMSLMRSPMVGRWEAKLPDGQGGQTDCIMDIKDAGTTVFSDTCPEPIKAGAGNTSAAKQSVYSPALYRPGDSGTYLFQGGTTPAIYGAFKRGWFGMTTRDDHLGEIKWRKIDGSKPLHSDADDVLPKQAHWPISDMPAIAGRATAYIRKIWKPDAVLTSIDIKLLKSNEGGSPNLKTADGNVELRLGYYSPATHQGLQFTPGDANASLYTSGSEEESPGGAIPDTFLDLPDAVALLQRNGMRARSIHEAQLEDWSQGSSAGGARLGGLQWMIDSQLDERFVVNARK